MLTKVVKDRSFIRGSVVPFEEDLLHEFKGHRTISIQDRLVFWLDLVANSVDIMDVWCPLFSLESYL